MRGPEVGISSLGGECISVALLSLASLTLEISLTRVLSLVAWYHFAFMVVSIALFGYGAAGAVLSVFPGLRKDGRVLIVSSWICSIAVVLCLVFPVVFHFDPMLADTEPFHLVMIVLQYLSLGIPFFLSGICLASVISRHSERSSIVYFSDLTGAGLGCIAALLLLPLGGPKIPVFFAAVAAALASAIFSYVHGGRRLIFLGLATGLALLLVGGVVEYDPEISEYKAMSAVLRQPGAEREWSSWNEVSRVDVLNSSMIRYAPGMPFEKYYPIPEQLGLTVDGDNLEPITRFSGNLSDLSFMRTLPSSVPYQMSSRSRVLVIRSGAGFDVLKALVNGAERVSGTERNPGIVEVVGKEFERFSGDIYSREDVDLARRGVRSYLGEVEGNFDLMEISLKQDPVTSAVGMYSLSENYLFTTESFGEMFEHLSPEGVLTVTRWLSPPPRQGARVVSLMVDCLEREGVDRVGEHIACFRTYLTITAMIKKTPFTVAEIDDLRRICEERSFDLVYVPNITRSDVNRFNLFDRPYYFNAISKIVNDTERESFLSDYIFDLSPPTDDSPFFFDFLKLGRLGDIAGALGPAWNPFLEGGLLILAVSAQSLVASFLFIMGPIWLSSKLGHELEMEWRWISYFLCLGGGYMLVEVSFLQRLILFLGQPSHAMGVTLFCMLVFSGLGSLWSGRFRPSSRLVGLCVLGIVFMVLAHVFLFSFLIGNFMGLGIWMKSLVAVSILAPVAFLMGIPFPTGLRVLGKNSPDSVPLAYGSNSCASVVASAGAMVLAGWGGFSGVLLLAIVLYLIGFLSLKGVGKSG